MGGVTERGGEEGVLQFLRDAIAKTPLPSPWVMRRDQHRRAFFANNATGGSSWSHPLEPVLRELAGVCRTCLASSPETRRAWMTKLQEKYQGDAAKEWAKWYEVKHE